MDFALNGLPLTEAEITLPLHGVWVADILTSDPDATLATGSAVTLLFGELVLLGTVLRGAESFGANHLRIAGGHGGFGLPASPQGWNDATYWQIAQATLAGQKEQLSATVTSSSAPTLFGHTSFWTVQQEPIGLALSRIVNAVGLQWRVLPDGTVWIGTETWPPAAADPSLTLIQQMPEQGRDWFGTGDPALLPGTTLDGRHVADVLYRVHRAGDESQSIRASVLYAD